MNISWQLLLQSSSFTWSKETVRYSNRNTPSSFHSKEQSSVHSTVSPKLAICTTSFLYQLLTALDKPSQCKVLSLLTTLKSSLDPPLISCACTNQCSNKATFNTQQKGYRKTKAQGFVYVYIYFFPFNIHPLQILASLKWKQIKK